MPSSASGSSATAPAALRPIARRVTPLLDQAGDDAGVVGEPAHQRLGQLLDRAVDQQQGEIAALARLGRGVAPA